MQDPRDKRIYIDDNGNEWLTNENGELLKDENGNNIPPSKTNKTYSSSGWTFYDSSKGHCPLCGNISCRGTCFK
ncbi:MAG: hypothetical protein IPJ81_06580 [Chitinophagaceae bacterium]|nr:hypothetical protein [Chitinophagaceae bacterium]